MAIPPELTRLIHTVLLNHYRKHHGADDPDRVEIFAESFIDRLLGPLAIADAFRAADQLDIQPLQWVSVGADEIYRQASVLRETLCREIRQWLEGATIWRYSAKEKSLAFARSIANASDSGTYATALANAKLGHRQVAPHDGVSVEERRARDAEERYNVGRRR